MFKELIFTAVILIFSVGIAKADNITFSEAHTLLCKAVIEEYPNKFENLESCVDDTQVEESDEYLTLEFDVCPESSELVMLYLDTNSREISSGSEGFDCE